MYEQIQRLGRRVALPKPFVYTLSHRERPGDHASLILYDNAGEHFQPHVDLDTSPGALHVAHSSAIVFLFNPASHPNFRRALAGIDDPQLKQAGIRDGQDILIAEMESRIRRLRNLPSHQRIQTPLAIVIGKADLWRTLFDWERLLPTYENGKLRLDNIERNSELLRELMLDHAPGVVANAEALSQNVRFFAASGLGHSPKLLTSGPMEGYLAPDPRLLRPRSVEVPFIWALQQSAPTLFNTPQPD